MHSFRKVNNTTGLGGQMKYSKSLTFPTLNVLKLEILKWTLIKKKNAETNLFLTILLTLSLLAFIISSFNI